MKLHIFILFILTSTYTLIDQWLTQQTQIEIGNPNGASSIVWIYGIASILVGMLFPLLSALVIFSIFKKEKSPFVYVQKFFSQALIEVLRGWGKALSWSFLFIIPGLIKFAQFFFIPFVVCFDPNYQHGKVDALESSQKVAKGRLIKLILLLLLFDAVLPLILSVFDDYSVIWKTPPQALLLCFVEMLFNICFIGVLWRMYEPTVSMERH